MMFILFLLGLTLGYLAVLYLMIKKIRWHFRGVLLILANGVYFSLVFFLAKLYWRLP